MNITSITNSIAAGRLASAKATSPGGNDKVAGALQQADKRIQQRRDSTSVQLSSFGKLQSAVAETQTASRGLSDSKQSATDVGVKKAASTFVSSFNTAVKTAKLNITAQITSAETGNARKAEGELRQAVSKEPTLVTDLKAIGITQKKDGGLEFDTRKFDAALQTDPTSVRSTLDKLGQQVDRTATKQLATTGNIGSAVSTLNTRANRLETQQEDQQARAAAAQQVVANQGARLGNTLNGGAATYQQIFSI